MDLAAWTSQEQTKRAVVRGVRTIRPSDYMSSSQTLENVSIPGHSSHYHGMISLVDLINCTCDPCISDGVNLNFKNLNSLQIADTAFRNDFETLDDYIYHKPVK